MHKSDPDEESITEMCEISEILCCLIFARIVFGKHRVVIQQFIYKAGVLTTRRYCETFGIMADKCLGGVRGNACVGGHWSGGERVHPYMENAEVFRPPQGVAPPTTAVPCVLRAYVLTPSEAHGHV